jgi:hypothetical protein
MISTEDRDASLALLNSLDESRRYLKMLSDAWEKRLEHITISLRDDPIKRINERIRCDWEAMHR